MKVILSVPDEGNRKIGKPNNLKVLSLNAEIIN
jgi:hypothetical protein